MTIHFNKKYLKFGVLKHKDEKSQFSIRVSRSNIGLILEALTPKDSQEK